jgi:hypothetical protein
MTRLTLALAAWISLISAASATLTPRSERPTTGGEIRPAAAPRSLGSTGQRTAACNDAAEYVLTEETEVLLNGKPCRYREVPASATILRMEVAPDRKTVLKVLFGTQK